MSERTPATRMRATAQTLREASPDDGWAMRLIADGLDNDADDWESGLLPDDMLDAALELAASFEDAHPEHLTTEPTEETDHG